MTIGEKIKKLRNDEKLSQQEVANMLGIDRSNYSKYELGKLQLNIDMLAKLATFYDVSTDYLIGLEEF